MSLHFFLVLAFWAAVFPDSLTYRRVVSVFWETHICSNTCEWCERSLNGPRASNCDFMRLTRLRKRPLAFIEYCKKSHPLVYEDYRLRRQVSLQTISKLLLMQLLTLMRQDSIRPVEPLNQQIFQFSFVPKSLTHSLGLSHLPRCLFCSSALSAILEVD